MRRKDNHIPECHLHENCHREEKEEANEFCKLSFVEQEKKKSNVIKSLRILLPFQMIPKNLLNCV